MVGEGTPFLWSQPAGKITLLPYQCLIYYNFALIPISCGKTGFLWLVRDELDDVMAIVEQGLRLQDVE